LIQLTLATAATFPELAVDIRRSLGQDFWRGSMPYIAGVLTGVALTVLVVFLIDNFERDPDTNDIVNWDYVSASLGSSVKKVGEEVRQEVHEATAPDDKDTRPPPADTDRK
jgi:hypothetical protein